MVGKYIALIRPYHYFKNLFIFAPLFFGLKITNVELLFKTFLAFVSFSLIASTVYIFNDYHDVEEDKRHPTKKKRPIACGAISKRASLSYALILLLLGVSISFLLSHTILSFVLIYLALNTAYTMGLKHIAIIDVFIIATGFVIRLFIGSAATNIELSMWIILMTFLLALFLALAKRRDDVLIFLESGEKTRKVVDGYNLDILNQSMTIIASVTIVSYIMYTVSPDIIKKAHSDKLYLSVLFVMLGMMRYLQIAFVDKDSGSPTDILSRDRFIQLSILGWVLTLWILLY
jgi:decaprenyl-phosphate phosphoribosyltransferase